MNRNGMYTEMMIVTPALAAEWLKKNDTNRPIKPKHLQQLCTAMREGTFVTNHQGIAIGEDGTLLDGQHRLKAIVATGLSQTMLVSFNVSTEGAKYVDRGAKRTDSDALHMSGRTGVTSRMTSVMNLMNSVFPNLQLDKLHIKERYYDTYEKEFMQALPLAKTQKIKGQHQGVMTAAFFIALQNKVSVDVLEQFSRAYYQNEILSDDDRIATALNREMQKGYFDKDMAGTKKFTKWALRQACFRIYQFNERKTTSKSGGKGLPQIPSDINEYPPFRIFDENKYILYYEGRELDTKMKM